jgi:hypothetical protein
MVLSLFGAGTVLGGRVAPKMKRATGALYFYLLASVLLLADGIATSSFLMENPGLAKPDDRPAEKF